VVVLREVPGDEGFVRGVRRGTWAGLAVLGAGTFVAPKAVRALVAGLTATIGIAHGATDAATLDRSGVRPRGGPATLSVAYGLLAIGVYALARRHPAAASRALRTVSWAHFGSGDAAFARVCGSRRFELVEAFVRGGVPLGIGGRDARSAACTIVACAYAAFAATSGDEFDALDVAVPALALYAAPPRLGFGCYFAAWHAPRHLALLLLRDPRGGDYSVRLLRFAREAAPNVAIASAFGALGYFLRGRDTAAEDVVPALILAITVPHQIAVWTIEYLARREETARS
jgi:hypothetical protein